MESSGMAIWLDVAFSGFDGCILRALHGFARMTGGRFTGFFEAVSMAAEKGIGMFLLFVLLVGASRCYLMVHYPSDLLGGLLVGALGAGLSLLITESVYPVMVRLLSNAPRAGKHNV